MKTQRIPFIAVKYDCEKLYKKGEEINGLELNVLGKGVIGENSYGMDITGILKYVEGDSKGFDITGGAKYIEGDWKGFDITGVCKTIDGESHGVNITGGVNYSGNVSKFLIEYGTLANIVSEAGKDAFVLQIGLWNKIGNQYCPVINVKGIKNLSHMFKRLWNRLEELD
jgi:hypothetical protein